MPEYMKPYVNLGSEGDGVHVYQGPVGCLF